MHPAVKAINSSQAPAFGCAQACVSVEGCGSARRARNIRATRSSVCFLLLSCLFIAASFNQAIAQAWPYAGTLPNMGAVAYDIIITSDWSPRGLRMTGSASSQSGAVQWVHCIQAWGQPMSICRLMVNGNTSGAFPLPPDVDLQWWLLSRFPFRRPNILPFEGGPSGAMETSGEWRWGQWIARGKFRYWR